MSHLRRGAVVVTGSSTGIGRACALGLDRAGFAVYAGVRKAEDGDALRAAAPRLEPLIVDVTDGEAIAAAAERVREATGGRLAGLVNNAGVAVAAPVEGVALDELRRQLEVNVVGQVAVTQAFLAMIRAARGRIVFMSSIGGRNALPFVSPYNASKHAIEAIGDSLRQEMRPFGVEVSIIEPGSVATPIWDKSTAGGVAARQPSTRRSTPPTPSASIASRRSRPRPARPGSRPRRWRRRSSTRSPPRSRRRAT